MRESSELRGRWRRSGMAVAAGWWLLAFVPLAAQQPPAVEPGQVPEETREVGRPPRSPYEAYDRGLYDQALQAFVDQQVERPEDPELLLNVGSVHYKMRDYEAAEETFARAATEGNEAVRAQALYNLGNTAFRQGRLEEAVQRYQAVLELDPDDEDAKFNLEFVRDEIRRRHEEAQKRQEQQGGQQPQPSEGQDPSQGSQQQDEQQGESQGDDSQQQEQQQQGQDQSQAGADPRDRDGDGLPDETELSGANPTDPDDPDSDADGLRDGEEDLNRNGRLDEGETDPNRADTDGDGTPDGEEQGATAGAQAAAGEQLEGMSEEEAERYLQALEEGRPRNEPARPGRRIRVEKDW